MLKKKSMQTRYRPPNECVFPNRVRLPAKVVTKGSLQLAKPYAAEILRAKKSKLQKHFIRFATRKYRCKPQQVTFTDKSKLLQTVSLGYCNGNLGETDGVCITISHVEPMTFDELIGVLVHECLHNYCLVRGKYMSCYNEHMCMRGLGDECVA